MTGSDGATSPWRGRCMCGQVHYAFSEPPLLSAVCHCRQCQRQSGSAFSIVAVVPRKGFQLAGETRCFADRADSGRTVERHFCPDCGSAVLSQIEPMPDMILIKAGTLDRCAELTPTIEVFCDTALPFVPPLAGTERHAGSNI